MYLDTGIIIKLLTPEPESAWFETELRGHPFSTSELALVEVRSALFAKERARSITAAQRLRAEAKFQEWLETDLLVLHPLNLSVLRKSMQVLAMTHPSIPLRSLDALHVAACDLAQEFPLCTTDGRVHDAAHLLRLPTFPEKLPLTS
jgi:predicted nucleic acid-binding protein